MILNRRKKSLGDHVPILVALNVMLANESFDSSGHAVIARRDTPGEVITAS